MAGAASRRKGHDFERWIARRFRVWFSASCRGRQENFAAPAPDVDGLPWWVECKSAKAVNFVAALEQAEADAARAHDARPCVVMAKKTGKPPMVAMRLDVFERLMKLGDHDDSETQDGEANA